MDKTKNRKNTKRVYFKRLLKIFMSTFYLSAFTFGGGYVIVSLLKKRFVDDLKWIDDEEMLDLVAIAQSTPGAVAINGAIVIGYRISGIPGAIAAVTGSVLPPLIILTVVAFFYDKVRDNVFVNSMLSGMRPAVAAVIISLVIDMGTPILKSRNITYIAIMLLAFILNYIIGIDVIYIVLISILFGIIRSFYIERKGRKDK